MRQRMQSHRASHRVAPSTTNAPRATGGDEALVRNAILDGPAAGGIALINRFDLVFLALLLFGFYVVAKTQYKVDLATLLWHYVKPQYDDGWHGDGDNGGHDLDRLSGLTGGEL